MGVFSRALCALPFAAALFTTPAAATLLMEGVIPEDDHVLGPVAGNWFPWVGSGVYVFTSEAEIIEYHDFSATPGEKYHGHAHDGQSWGMNNYGHVSWDYLGMPEPTFTLTPTGFTWKMQVPEDRIEYHPNACYYGDFGGCDFDEHYEYAIDLYMIMRFAPGSQGLPFKIEVFSLPGPSAVPEPGTWAMMIFGFGLAGAALRRRRSLSIA